MGGLEIRDGIGTVLSWQSAAGQGTPIRSRLEICKRLESLPLSSEFNRAFSIRDSAGCDSRFVARVGIEKIAKNLRLENPSSLILIGLMRNSNSRFAIRFRSLGIRVWRLEGTAAKGLVQAAPKSKEGIL
jgi:hypothetical protein